MTEIEKELVAALRLALSSHGVTLLSNPPQDAWLYNRVEMVARRALARAEQADPVSAPPKSFRVGYMAGYDDGQRELREKQQAEPVVEPVVEPEETYKAVPMKTVRTGVVTWDKQAEPVACVEALKAIIEFIDAPAEGKRPDVWALRVNKARAALAAVAGQ